MAQVKSLLEVLAGLIERTYDLPARLPSPGRFVIGDLGYARFTAGRRVRHEVGSASGQGAALLLRQDDGALWAALYYPDALIERLEASNPLQGLDESNLDAFGVFVEELDHLVTLADRVAGERPVSLFELELHADVTRWLATRHFLERTWRRPLGPGEMAWLRWRLFDCRVPAQSSPEVMARYRDAGRYASRYARALESLAPLERLREVRRFHRLDAGRAVRRIETVSSC